MNDAGKQPSLSRALRAIVLALCFFAPCAGGIAAAAAGPAGVTKGLESFQIGDVAQPTPGKTEAGLMLMGGGNNVDAAFKWLVAKAGHGHIVILRASGDDELQKYFMKSTGGVASVQTFIFHDRNSSHAPAVLDALRHADGIFIAGGDQANYVRFWKDTPVNELLDAHLRAGKPIGGTSAGLAILGAYSYGALDGGSIISDDAMGNPLGSGVTLVDGFLHMPYLQQVITDSHFNARGRLGRLIAFIARLRHEGHAGVVGIGVDENTALCIDGDGIGHVFTGSNGFAWLVQPRGLAETIAVAAPLRYAATRVTGVGPQSRIDFKDFTAERPAFKALAEVRDGKLDLHGTEAPLLVVHGGAGVERASMTPAIEAKARDALALALRSGYAKLSAGGSSLDAVTAAITVLEDDPLFNAGKGAVFTHDGRNELDASVMDGSTLAAGAVAEVHRIKNPVLLARAVLEYSPHVFMVGEGAENFAVEHGFQLVDPSYFRTDRRWQELQEAIKAQAKGGQASARITALKHYGTVGALARDSQGRLAAATSTGGLTDKRYGRIGDSPLIGAGTYADATCAVSGTGWGEYYIRLSAARDICMRMTEMHESAAQAGQRVINEDIPRLGGDGGAIVLGADGSVAMPFNTEGMYRGWIGTDGTPHVAIYSGDRLEMPGH